MLGDRVGAAAPALGRDSADFDRRINQNDLLGAYFLTHCFGGALATRARAAIDKSQTLDSDWATDYCATEAFLRGARAVGRRRDLQQHLRPALPISLGRTYGSQDLDTIWQAFIDDTRLIGDGAAWRFLDDNFGRGLSVSFMANQVPLKSEPHRAAPDGPRQVGPAGRLHHQGLAPPRRLPDGRARRQCRRPSWRKRRRYRAGSGRAASTWPRTRSRGSPTTSSAARASAPTRATRCSIRDCRAWEFDNLYVTDGAFMPTSGSANPTLTIQANAFRVADCILKRL